MKQRVTAKPWPLNIFMIAPQPFFTARGTPFSEYFRIKALTEMGHKVTLVTYHIGEDVELPGLTLKRTMPIPGIKSIKIGPSVTKIFLDVLLFFKAFMLLNKGEYHLIHTHEEAAVMGLFFRWWFRIPHLYDMHSDLSQQMRNFNFTHNELLIRALRTIEKWVLTHSEFTIAICEELAMTIRELSPDSPHAVIENSPLPYDLVTSGDSPPADQFPNCSSVEPQTTESTTKSSRPIVLYTGTFEIYQGIDLLLNSLPLLKRMNIDITLKLVGGTSKQCAAISRMVRERHIEDMVEIGERIPPHQLPALFEQADILVSPRSRGTNTPLKVYSYLAAAKPIIATNLRTHTQVLDPECAVLVEPVPSALAEAIQYVVEHPKRARELAQNAVEKYEKYYSYPVYLKKVSAVVEGAMNRWEQTKGASVREHYSVSLYRREDVARTFDVERFGSSFGKLLSRLEQETFKRYLGDLKDQIVLDAGGGTGRLAVPLMDEMGAKVILMDRSLEMMSIAREKGNAKNCSLLLAAATVEEIPLRDGSVDWVVSSRVIMHIPHWRKVIREYCRVSRYGVVFDYPPLNAFPALAVPVLKVKSIFDPMTQPYQAIQSVAVKRELKKSGFKVLALNKRFFLPVAFHRKLNKPTLSMKIETLFRALGLTGVFGAPVTLLAVRQLNNRDM